MSETTQLSIAVLQPGARLHYAVPAILQRAGMLQILYTDCAVTGAFRNLARIWPRQLQPAPLRRLLGRTLPPEVPAAKVRQVWFAAVCEHLRAAIHRKGINTSSRALQNRALKERFGGANAIYTVLVNEDIETCLIAKYQGCRIIHEVMLTPDAGLLTYGEYTRHAPLESRPLLSEIESGRDRDRAKYALADLILVPSEFVRDAVLDLGAVPSKVAVVPYGIDRLWLNVPSHPVRGRVLFVGSVGFRKGNHCLAESAQLLARRAIDCEVRVVGPLENGITWSEIFAGPTYLGQVPRADIHREYSNADIFVLPSFAEGMAIVTLEAMAVGLPVITTPNAGSAVRHEIDGFIVPPGDPVALADAIERLVGNRTLRARMSRNAKARAAEFTWDEYEKRLKGALTQLRQQPEHERQSAHAPRGGAWH